MKLKPCNHCKEVKPLTQFNKHSAMADGHINVCKACRKSYHAKYYGKNKKQLRAKHREYYFNNLQSAAVYNRKYYAENTEKIHQSQRAYYLNNKTDFLIRAAFRRKLVLQATPKWADMGKIRVLYAKCKWLESITGLKYHVDHVIPLQGEGICGLHVWENLQILEASENIRKSNSVNYQLISLGASPK